MIITAIGVLRAIKDLGLKIPKDISVISIDDIDVAQCCPPRSLQYKYL